MAFTTLSINPDTLRTEAVESIRISKGTLLNISAHVDSGSGEPSQCFATLELTADNTNINSRKALLAQGYIGGHVGIMWSGAIVMENDMLAVCRVFSSTGNTVRFSVVNDVDQ